jgi:hypothetical protein
MEYSCSWLLITWRVAGLGTRPSTSNPRPRCFRGGLGGRSALHEAPGERARGRGNDRSLRASGPPKDVKPFLRRETPSSARPSGTPPDLGRSPTAGSRGPRFGVPFARSVPDRPRRHRGAVDIGIHQKVARCGHPCARPIANRQPPPPAPTLRPDSSSSLDLRPRSSAQLRLPAVHTPNSVCANGHSSSVHSASRRKPASFAMEAISPAAKR